MGHQFIRGRNNGNYHRGGSSQMLGGRGYYDQFPAQYLNHPQPFYQHQQISPSIHMGLSYRMNTNVNNNNNNNNNNNRYQLLSAESRQRLNSNRSNSSRTYNDNSGRLRKGYHDNLDDINNSSVSSGKVGCFNS